MSSARHHRKGDHIEREIVALHQALEVHSERHPLSGTSRFRGSGHDIDVHLFGAEEATAVCEAKARKNGAGFATLERWLGELRRNGGAPLVLVSWPIWVSRLLERVRQ